MWYFIGGILVIWIISWLRTKPFRRIESVKKLRDMENVNYVLDKLTRDFPSLNNSHHSVLQCSAINCNHLVQRYNLAESIAIELLKPINFDRRMEIYCVPHSSEILQSLQRTTPINDFNKALETAKLFKNVMTNR